MADSPILIVGGGIAGLAVSLGLAKIGKPTQVLEKAARFETVGAGLQLGPNAVRALQYLGAWDAVAPACVSPEEIHIRDAISGNTLQRIILGTAFEMRFGAPYRVAHRTDLQNALIACAQGQSTIQLQNGAEVVNVSISETSLTLKSGETRKAAAILAADGIHSIVRNAMLPGSAPNSTGHTLFRQLIPIDAVPSCIETNVITLWLYPGGHVVHYAVSQGKQFNVVASLQSTGATPDSAFQNACTPLSDLLNGHRQWLEWRAFDLTPNPNWSMNKTVTIGDAAHASLPYLAQGAAMALEDACVLTRILHSGRNATQAFEDFSTQRFMRTSKIRQKSRQLGRLYHATGNWRLARNLALKITPPRVFMNRLKWIYQWQDDKGDI